MAKYPKLQLYIGGEWAEAEGGRTFEDRDPFTDEVVAPGACVTVHCDLATPIDSSASVRMAVAEDGRLPECGDDTGNVIVVGTFIGCE